jgi:hypothetical protein
MPISISMLVRAIAAWSLVVAVALGLLAAMAKAQDTAPGDLPPPTGATGQDTQEQSLLATPGSNAPEQLAAGEAQPLEYGPIHEAFADTYMLQQTDQLIVDQQPPKPVNELPPEQTIDSDRAEWINGYWMWDEVRDDFVWVSGVWRVIPPGQRWVPGYWSAGAQEGQFVWTSGFWGRVDQAEVTYLPAPPESLEQGPNSPAPSDNHFWVPGCWRWNGEDYAWRAGDWSPVQPNWVWIPSRYSYTPRGYVFVRGYWDYPLSSRGLLYAPVSIAGYRNVNTFNYRPNRVLNTAALLSYLLVGNNRGHYYYRGPSVNQSFDRFGYVGWHDYFGNRRGNRGNRYGYDPLFTFYSSTYGRGNNNWFSDYSRRYATPPLGRGIVQDVATFARILDNDTDDRFGNGRRQLVLKPFTGESSDYFRDRTNNLRDIGRLRNQAERPSGESAERLSGDRNEQNRADRNGTRRDAPMPRDDNARNQLDELRRRDQQQQDATRQQLDEVRRRLGNRSGEDRGNMTQPGANAAGDNVNRSNRSSRGFVLPDATRRSPQQPLSRPQQSGAAGQLNRGGQPGNSRPANTGARPRVQPNQPQASPAGPAFRGFRNQGNRPQSPVPQTSPRNASPGNPAAAGAGRANGSGQPAFRGFRGQNRGNAAPANRDGGDNRGRGGEARGGGRGRGGDSGNRGGGNRRDD